jgi:hypothetical protein
MHLASGSRRSFFLTLGQLFGAIFTIPSFPRQNLAALRLEDLLIEKVVRTLRGPHRAVVLVGEVCLRETVSERSAQHVARLILDQAPPLADACSESGDECFRVAVQQQMRHDFATGEVVRVAGYVLSVTESRLCSLAALVERQGL